MKYLLGWTITQYYETVVDADSEEEAREIFADGGICDCWTAGDAGDAELQYCDEIPKEKVL